MTQVYNHILVEVLPLYYPSEDEKANPQLYASNVRKLMGKVRTPWHQVLSHLHLNMHEEVCAINMWSSAAARSPALALP